MYRSLLLNMLLLCIVYGAGMNYTGPCTSTSKLDFSQPELELVAGIVGEGAGKGDSQGG
jgi:hypothetical protein